MLAANQSQNMENYKDKWDLGGTGIWDAAGHEFLFQAYHVHTWALLLLREYFCSLTNCQTFDGDKNSVSFLILDKS